MSLVLRLGFVALFVALAGCDSTNTGTGDGGDDQGTGDDLTGTPPPDLSIRCPSGVLCGSPAACCMGGEDCVNGACVAGCASTIRCGADQLTCCAADQVCLSQSCSTPTTACVDSFDCADGEFCEPTLLKCLPQPTGAQLCQVTPTFPSYTASPDWQWRGHADTTGTDTDLYENVCVTPIVGDVDADGTPDVVIGAYPTGKEGNARLVILDGKTGAEKRVLPLSQLNLNSFASLAIGNLDGDAELEIVGMATTTDKGGAGLFILDHLSTTPVIKCVATSVNFDARTSPSIANMNADAAPEIIAGGIVVDANCNILFDAKAGIGHSIPNANTLPASIGCNTNGCLNGVADLDGDMNQDGAGHPLPELVGGAMAYRYNKTTTKWEIYWDHRADATLNTDGYVAIADIDTTHAGPEVVVVSAGKVYMRDGRTGAVIPFDTGVPSADIGGNGGPPTIADFDGDGHLEFASAGQAAYKVYDPDCKATPNAAFCGTNRTGMPVGVLWSKVTQDLSSSVTGSSVFDFQGDGAAEVIYNDECYLRVYDGRTGNILLELPNSSRTATEYPIVADVNADNRSEFIVPSNHDKIARDKCPYCPTPISPATCGQGGITVFHDPAKKWVRTRRIWNEHAYHVSNVLNSGDVPATEPNNWETSGLNNYRQNVQGAGVFNAPDLVITGVSVDLALCPDKITIQATISNQGSLGVAAGIPVTFYRGTSAGGMVIGTAVTKKALLPGGSDVVQLDFSVPLTDAGPFDFFVSIGGDADAGVLLECKSDNNSGKVSDVSCGVIG